VKIAWLDLKNNQQKPKIKIGQFRVVVRDRI